MGLYADTIPQYRKMLANLDAWLGEANDTATEAGYPVGNLLIARLAPDQFNLTRNVQAACDTFKLAGARMASVEAPKHEDGPATLEELRARIADVRAFLEGLDADTIDAAASTVISPAFLRGNSVRIDEYARSFAGPNGYFHLCMVYAILRHNGIKLGKMAFLGGIQFEPKAE